MSKQTHEHSKPSTAQHIGASSGHGGQHATHISATAYVLFPFACVALAWLLWRRLKASLGYRTVKIARR